MISFNLKWRLQW